MKKELDCGVGDALAVIGGKWKFLILFRLGQETLRFGELRKCIDGISDKVFIQQLKELEGDFILIRKDYGQARPRVEYSVSSLGQALIEALAPLSIWGCDYKKKQAAPATLVRLG